MLVIIVFLVGIVVLQWWGGSSRSAVMPMRPFTKTEEENPDEGEDVG